MGNYNPHAPQILGQEWAPIREENIAYAPAINTVERGHRFTLTTSRRVRDARFYVAQDAQGINSGQVFLVSIYPSSGQIPSGPVRKVSIPVSAVTTNGTLVNAATNVAALASPSDYGAIEIDNITLSGEFIECSFAVNQYANLLTNKRILAVNVKYTAQAGIWDNSAVQVFTGDPIDFYTILSQQVDAGSTDDIYADSRAGNFPVNVPPKGTSLAQFLPRDIFTAFLGEMCINRTVASTTDSSPWTFTTLAEFDSAGRKYTIVLNVDASDPSLGATKRKAVIGYVQMEVYYCDEARSAYGANYAIFNTPGWLKSTQPVLLRSANTLVADPVLIPGAYDLVVSSPNLGGLFIPGTNQTSEKPPVVNSVYPPLNGLRELYRIPSHPGVQNNVPFPVEDHVGDEFVSVETHILPQLSLHVSGSGAPLTEPHVYGRQAAAQVWGPSNAPIQRIDDSPVPANTPFAHTRFYARRFGDTTVPLRLLKVVGGDNVSITPEAFDALPEIIDGWKEITFDWNVKPTMGAGTNPEWQWDAREELANNRWEILGAIAPALSGVPGNLYNQVPLPQRLSIATYGAPTSGAPIDLDWSPGYTPFVSTTTDDPLTDAVLFFGQESAIISGFGLEVLDQQVVGVGLDCGLNPCCIPSEIQYLQLTWDLPFGTSVVDDDFNRVVAPGSWGNTSDGNETWTLFGTAADFSVDGSQGNILSNTVGNDYFASFTSNGQFQDVQVTGTIDSAVSTRRRIGVVTSFTDDNNHYLADLQTDNTVSPGTATLRISKRVGGVFTNLQNLLLPNLLPSFASQRIIRMQFEHGSVTNQLRAKVWAANLPEPDWQIILQDSSLSASGVGVFARTDIGSAGNYLFDNFMLRPPDFTTGYTEIQRMDTVETDWKAIMKAVSPAVTTFNDYEARVGIVSSYRIRNVDLYGFLGPWSPTVTGMVPAPGVTIGCDDGHLLIFTSNEHQDGSINLAYSSVWESGTVEEAFTFPEAGFVQLQAMYNRDFFTAFRPTERGGESFERTVLVQAAAIAPETLADFTGLRDMAWDSVSYICVRDEDGNRWLATVVVPSGRVLRDRRLYLAPVNIIEVTDTPSPVDAPL